MSKAYLVIFKGDRCTDVVGYDDPAQARIADAAIMDKFMDQENPDKSTRSKLIFASSPEDVGFAVGDKFSDTDDLELQDLME